MTVTKGVALMQTSTTQSTGTYCPHTHLGFVLSAGMGRKDTF